MAQATLADQLDLQNEHWPTVEECLNFVKIAAQSEINRRNRGGWTPIRVVLERPVEAEVEILVEALLARQADPSLSVSRQGNLASIHEAARRGYMRIVQLMVGACPDSVNTLTADRLTPVMYALQANKNCFEVDTMAL
jgi:hypothetical protein